MAPVHSSDIDMREILSRFKLIGAHHCVQKIFQLQYTNHFLFASDARAHAQVKSTEEAFNVLTHS